ncbi:MAG: hypothetical protein GX326_05850 [Clostridiaceae bacterium]|nr:hypothetical protein [Clostridiaceae bacterium]
MIAYFFVALSASVILAIMLFLMLRWRLRINSTGSNKIGISYVMPVIIVILFVSVIIVDTFPRILDTVFLFQNNVKTISVPGDKIDVKKHRYLIGDEIYITGFRDELIDPDLEYSISYLPNTKIVLKREEIVTLPEIDPSKLNDEETNE